MSGHRLVSTSSNTFFYGATKFAVTALTEGVRRELRQENSDVKVTVRILSTSFPGSYHFSLSTTIVANSMHVPFQSPLP